MPPIEQILLSHTKDLGSLTVRRVLPSAKRRMVGPFIFFDHMGPSDFPPSEGIDVRPHPHIGLATVTYLFEGKIFHRDSLGSRQVIEPGAVNWMIAGRGIVHSERSPAESREHGGRMSGIQCWVALPNDAEEMDPSFTHHPASTLPEFQIAKTKLKLLAGTAFGKKSPAPCSSDLFYLEAKVPKTENFSLLAEGRESAVYVVKGKITVDGQELNEGAMATAKNNKDLLIEALEDSQLMLLGGAPVGERFIWWNLVASTQEKLADAKREWENGPGPGSKRFPSIPGDDKEFIPAPELGNLKA